MKTIKYILSWQKIGILVIVGLVAISLPLPISNKARAATVLHVPGEYASIQWALSAAISGDTILVDPGIYSENLNFYGKDVTLQSESGANATTIVHVEAYQTRAINIGPAGKLIGFTISDPAGWNWGGVNVIGTGSIIRENIFENNFAERGAAIFGDSASPIIDGNIFRNNYNGYCWPALLGIVFFQNYSSPLIVNNLFVNNTCNAIGMMIDTTSSPQIINNTIVSNEAGIYITSGSPIFRNNLIYKNFDFGLCSPTQTVNFNPIWENNLVYGNIRDFVNNISTTGTNGNISTDPRLKANSQPPYMLRASSPAIDAGSNNLCPTHDFLDQPRPQGTNCDIGAFEFGGEFTYSQDNYRVNEYDGSVLITVSLYPPLDVDTAVDYTIPYEGDTDEAVPGDDYTPINGTLTFPAGSREETFSITLTEDDTPEPDETISLILSNVTGTEDVIASDTATVTIFDLLPEFTYSQDNYRVNENDGFGLITVSLNTPLPVVATVDYSTSYSSGLHEAVPGNDYIPTSGTLTFPAGVQQQSFSIPLVDNSVAESDEIVSLVLSNATSTEEVITNDTATLTIFDLVPQLTFASDNFRVDENSGSALITVSMNTPLPVAATVDYSTSYNGGLHEAVPGNDYTPTSGTLTFPAGDQQQSFSIPLIDDNLTETNETISLILNNASSTEEVAGNDTASITIYDIVPKLTFSPDHYAVNEADGSILITVSLDHAMGVTATVDYAATYTGGLQEAIPGVDYASTSGTLTFPAGSQQETFNIPLINDDTAEPDETIALTLSNASSMEEIAGDDTASVTIVKNDWRYAYLPLCTNRFCNDFLDDFSNPSTGWSVTDDAYVRSQYLNGEFRVLSKKAGYFFMFSAPTCERLNYSVEVDARWEGTTGGSYGILFGLIGNYDSFYIFDINTDLQQYRVISFDDQGGTIEIGPLYSSAIHTGSGVNHLKIVRIGSSMAYFYVNSTMVTGWGSNGILGFTRVGLISSSYSTSAVSDARFDNFRVVNVPDTYQGTGYSAPHVPPTVITDPVYMKDQGNYILGKDLPVWR